MPEINYVWDPTEDNIVREYDEAGVVTAEYTTEPDLYGNVISQRRQGEYRQFHFDAQGSTLAVTDDNQNVTDTFAYTGFGEGTERTGTSIIIFQYIARSGYYTDPVLPSNIYVRRRHYRVTASISRWQSPDPIYFHLFSGVAFVSDAERIGSYRQSAVGLNILRFKYVPQAYPEVNRYTYAVNRPLLLIDPSGLQAVPPAAPPRRPTGICEIFIFAGHWGATAKAFLAAHNVDNATTNTGCGNYLGFITCFSGDYEDSIHGDRKIPDFPDFGGLPLSAEKALPTLNIGLESARDLAARLCANRRTFCDDGSPERYECGTKNQRCDKVTISITCDADMTKLLTTGVGPSGGAVSGLPTTYSKGLCPYTKTITCPTTPLPGSKPGTTTTGTK